MVVREDGGEAGLGLPRSMLFCSTTLEEVKIGSVMDFYQALVKHRKGLAVIGSSHTGN